MAIRTNLPANSRLSYISGIDFALNDIQNGDITSSFAWCCKHHTVFGLEETPHNVEDSRSPDRFGLVTSSEHMKLNCVIAFTLSI